MRTHLRHDDPKFGRIPLCGNAMWDELTDDNDECDCWECLSIVGIDIDQREKVQ